MPDVAVATTSGTAADRLLVRLFAVQRCPWKLDLPLECCATGLDGVQLSFFLGLRVARQVTL